MKSDDRSSSRRTIRLRCAAMLVLLGVATFALAGDRVTGEKFSTRSEVIAQHGMACTSHPLATQVAIDILKQGGSAVDAAIAANAVLGLMEPTSNGIGGDLFALVWDSKSAQLHGINGSGRAPLGLSLAELREKSAGEFIPDFGPLPITVPGCVDAWFELHQRFGKLPMKDVLAPAIRYAREGFPVTEVIAHYWAIGGKRLREYPNFATTYLPDGRAPAKGDIFRNPALADTLAEIAANGRDAFYRGPLTERMDAFSRQNGCYLRRIDFEQHKSTWVKPISTNYRGYDVWELPPNGQGVIALEMLNIVEGFDLRGMKHNSADYLHTLIEAKKIAFADRAARLGGSDEAEQAAREVLSNKAFAAARRSGINMKLAATRVAPGEWNADAAGAKLPPPPDPLRQGRDTIYLTVADGDHNMVSLIQSNYRGFGSGLVPTEMGFCFQDRGCQFTLKDGHPNTYAPGKRPFHTIIPAFVTRDGKPYISFGVMGGDMQPQGHVQVLCNLIDFGMNLQEAGDAPRFYHTGSAEPTGFDMTDGGKLGLESGIPESVRTDLAQRGHKLAPIPDGFGGYQAILYDVTRNVLIGASESRKDGCAMGY